MRVLEGAVDGRVCDVPADGTPPDLFVVFTQGKGGLWGFCLMRTMLKPSGAVSVWPLLEGACQFRSVFDAVRAVRAVFNRGMPLWPVLLSPFSGRYYPFDRGVRRRVFD